VGENPGRGDGPTAAASIKINTGPSGSLPHCRWATEILRLEPRGLSRIQSATYIGVSPALFDELVGDGRMPQPKKINSRVVWDRKQLDESFEALPDREDRKPWDEEDAA
jgi:predicted DNA-binding transcriptional regulator AlpA